MKIWGLQGHIKPLFFNPFPFFIPAVPSAVMYQWLKETKTYFQISCKFRHHSTAAAPPRITIKFQSDEGLCNRMIFMSTDKVLFSSGVSCSLKQSMERKTHPGFECKLMLKKAQHWNKYILLLRYCSIKSVTWLSKC